jgi:branched-subunit amino acid aminotransferase/4-amino-4-deoxychorismate lyase
MIHLLCSTKSLDEELLQFSNENFYLFETLKIEEGKLNDLDLHLVRLFNSLSVLKKTILKSQTELHSMLDLLSLPHTGRLRLNYSNHNIWVEISPLPNYNENLKLGFDAEAVVDSKNHLLQHKTHLYAKNKSLLEKHPELDDIIFINEDGFLTETTKANIFIFDHHKLRIYTPPLKCGLLPGIERQKLLSQKKISCQNKEYLILEKEVRKIEVNSLTDIMLTNSLMGVKFGKIW